MSAPIKAGDDASAKIAKLLPADITGALLAIKSVLSVTTLSQDWLVYGGIAIAVLAPFYFVFVNRTTNVLHIAFLMGSYAIFFMSLGPVELANVFKSLRPVIDGLNAILTPIWIFIVTPIFANVLNRQLVSK